ncbi:oxidoreductase-2 [Coleophoma crateriformis]|uniref:D-xylose 1-dehydrogenase (NADP(+), D-xylono-1,5-lactone-forming) n=1 Tax=Coleophoma crateriformis TaxID=565419 RepID=A0A3D8S239_9HELO|nr:oxidoreductase-2 [Coleophoma crateriformis]
MASPKTIRWGILATGGIAATFTKDLLVDPTTRGVSNIKHIVVAAASSSSKSRAESFLRECDCDASTAAYGSYEELVRDPNIDIVYIATPHSHHYQNAMLALEAGKHILCEKAFTINAEQAKKLVAKAKEKNVLLMEAVWTRYFPLSIYVRETIQNGVIGPVSRVISDNSVSMNPTVKFADGKHRMVNPDLGGGALLDLGIYSLTWIFQTAYHTQAPGLRQPPEVLAAVKKYRGSAADETTTVVLNFPRPESAGGDIHAIATTSLSLAGPGSSIPAVRIQGTKGEIQVFGPAPRPNRTKLMLADGTIEEKAWSQPGPEGQGQGQGMFWEADEAASAVLEGRKEGKYLGWEETITIMEVMDEIRRQGDLKYPDKIETTEYPTAL